jgi:uncharacterized Fe-S cluster-containing radical SAM superfamily protein
MGYIDTDNYSAKLRAKAIDLNSKKILITRLGGSAQETDFSEPSNCAGYGRVRHFRRVTSAGWPENPLPIDPALVKLGLPRADILKAQVFQNSACNWRCWYCFVPFELLAADQSKAAWLNAKEMVDFYRTTEDRPKMIDLSGGQPDLTPEWIPWMMEELKNQGLDSDCYLWSDDNLSNDYFWRFLSPDHIKLIRTYRNYGKVCCFKGFDAESFAFNTAAAPELFDRQFELFGRYLEIGIDLYAYATFTSPSSGKIDEAMKRFVDRLQELHPNLPLRTVPLEIKIFSPTQKRTKTIHETATRNQQEAIRCWNRELESRFAPSARQSPIYEISIK